ncbi:hypothetical protein [Paenochrobactrum pullorum]
MSDMTALFQLSEAVKKPLDENVSGKVYFPREKPATNAILSQR